MKPDTTTLKMRCLRYLKQATVANLTKENFTFWGISTFQLHGFTTTCNILQNSKTNKVYVCMCTDMSGLQC